MIRKTFFSFHYKRDVWRAGQVRNSNLLAKEDKYGFVDSAEWEKIEKQGEEAVKRWINEQLNNTSVTVVLIGAETSERDWVDYEIRRSWERGNALLGIYIHNVEDQYKKTDLLGKNPFDYIKFTNGITLSSICKTYDWVNDNGRDNLGLWIEEAFQAKSKYEDKKLSEQKNNGKTDNSSSIRNSATSDGFTPKQPWSINN